MVTLRRISWLQHEVDLYGFLVSNGFFESDLDIILYILNEVQWQAFVNTVRNLQVP
jgi:hypothetical protein